MPYNGSGVFSTYTPGNPVVTGTTISSTWANNTLSDIATGLSTAITKDGQTTVTANIPMAGFKITGLGLGTASTDAASLANIQANTGTYVATVGGTADAITLTPSPAIAAYAAGQSFSFIASGANTTAVTVAISGLTAKSVTKAGSTALVAGDIASGALTTIEYDGTRFQLLGAGVYLPLGGGTLTGGLIGTTASFTDSSAPLTITSTDAGAGAGPVFAMDRNSASPAAADSIGQMIFKGRDSGGNATNYAWILGKINDPTDTSEDGQLNIATMVAGSFANRWLIANGLYGATLTDQGTETVNAQGYYLSGTALPIQKSYTSTAQTITSAGTLTLAHGLGVAPKTIQLSLVNVTTEGGWVTGDEVFVPSGVQPGTNVGVQAFVLNGDTTNIKVVFGAAASAITILSNAGGAVAITNANWTLKVRAFA